MRRLVLTCGILMVAASRLAGQAPDVTDELIFRVLADVADFRYGEAIERGRQLLAPGTRLTPAQEIRLRTALAAAFYPDFDGDPRPDSALAQLDRVIRLAPDAQLPITLSWPGLDSLLEVSRARTFAVVLRSDADSLGVDGTGTLLTVVASRPASLRLDTRAVGTRSLQRQDASGERVASARLRVRAHDGRQVLLARGDYDLIVTAVDPTRGDSVQSVRRIIVDGSAPALLPPPVLDSARLQLERRDPHPWRTALLGAGFAVVTAVVAEGGRAEEPVRSAFAGDSRAGLVAIAALTAGAIAAWTDRDGVDREAVAFNAALRSAHERALAAALAENARRLDGHRVSVHLGPAGR